MSLHYLLDGYNIIHKVPFGSMDKLEDQRNNLVSMIQGNRPQGSSRNKVTVVFDGIAGFESSSKVASISIKYSRNRTADEEIKDIVEKSLNAKNIIVVTDDRAIQYAVRAEGAKIMNVKDFLVKCSGNISTSSKKGKSSGSAEKRIPKSIEHKINLEMRDIWLKK